MLPTSTGVEPATSWSPVGRRIQQSHRQAKCVADDILFLFFFSEKKIDLDISSESSAWYMIRMKFQDIFFGKIQKSSAAVVIGALKVNSLVFYCLHAVYF